MSFLKKISLQKPAKVMAVGSLRKYLGRALQAFALVALACVLSPFPAATQTLGIAAVVNDDVISLYDLESRLKMLIVTSNQKDSAQLRRRLTRQVLNSLIDEKLKMQEARRVGVNIPTRDIELTYNEMEASNNFPKGGLTDFLNKNGVDRLVLFDQIEATVSWAESINILFRGQTAIGEDEIDEVIDEINNGKGKPEYQASEIFLPVNNPNKANEVLQNANRLIEQISGGANFSIMARNYSQSASAAVGGDLGWVRQGQLPQEIDKNLMALKKGTISPPIRGASGYYIILKRNERIGQGLPPSKQKIDLRQVYLPLGATSTGAAKVALMAKATTMAARASSCTDMEVLEAESGSPLSGSLGVVDTSALPALIQKVVKDLALFTPSAPIPADGGIIFLMICKRTGTTGLDILRPKIRQRLITERLDNAARGHLRDLRNAAFLDVRI